jgi:hypothetical protein
MDHCYWARKNGNCEAVFMTFVPLFLCAPHISRLSFGPLKYGSGLHLQSMRGLVPPSILGTGGTK